MSKNYIAYYRVSMPGQGRSGLGLEAQQAAAKAFVGTNAIIDEFIEVESTRTKKRPKLDAALIACKERGATLIIAKLDRLARDVYVISGFMKAGIDFIALDNPNANKLMLHILAAFAEHERDMISQRTKEALKAANARGTKLGNPTIKALSNTFAKQLQPMLEEIMGRDIVTYRAIAAELNRLDVPTFKGKGKWYAPQVFNLMKKL